MIVRKAVAEDTNIIASFQLAMALETEQLMLDPDVVDKGVLAVFENPARGNYYVAEINGEVAGSLLTTYEWSDWRNGTVLWIQSVYVLPQHRRKGVYRNMYRYLQEMVMSDNTLRGIRLYVDISNIGAHRTYMILGMNADHYQTFEWMKS
jgi:ribosomal protein S18 acetylase RimI-like enzyme